MKIEYLIVFHYQWRIHSCVLFFLITFRKAKSPRSTAKSVAAKEAATPKVHRTENEIAIGKLINKFFIKY